MKHSFPKTSVCRVRVLISEAEIQNGVAKLARTLSAEYRDRPLMVLGVLTGSIVLLADLIRRIEIPLRVGLLQASSYRGQQTQAGELRINEAWLPEVADRDVLLLDDIFDTGRTLERLIEQVQRLGPRSIRSAVLLWKEGRQRVSLEPDYFCFRIPDEFVVGYGLDYNDEYRQLPFIAALEPGDIENSGHGNPNPSARNS